jgi:CAAX amino terminal protease family.
MKKVIKNIWKTINFPLMYIGVQMIISFVYSFVVGVVLGVKMGLSGEILQAEDLTNEIMLLSDTRILIIISACVTLLIVFLRVRKELNAENFWSFSKIKALPMIVCAVFGIALNMLMVGVLTFIPMRQQSVINNMIGDNFILEIVSIALLTPILEEIIFRGIVLKRLSKMMKLPIAIFLQSLIFAIVHFDPVQSVCSFILGIVLGLVYIWFDSIWFAVVFHIMYNITSITILHIAGNAEVKIIYFLIMTVIAIVVTIFSIIILGKINSKKETVIITDGKSNV